MLGGGSSSSLAVCWLLWPGIYDNFPCLDIWGSTCRSRAGVPHKVWWFFQQQCLRKIMANILPAHSFEALGRNLRIFADVLWECPSDVGGWSTSSCSWPRVTLCCIEGLRKAIWTGGRQDPGTHEIGTCYLVNPEAVAAMGKGKRSQMTEEWKTSHHLLPKTARSGGPRRFY